MNEFRCHCRYHFAAARFERNRVFDCKKMQLSSRQSRKPFHRVWKGSLAKIVLQLLIWYHTNLHRITFALKHINSQRALLNAHNAESERKNGIPSKLTNRTDAFTTVTFSCCCMLWNLWRMHDDHRCIYELIKMTLNFHFVFVTGETLNVESLNSSKLYRHRMVWHKSLTVCRTGHGTRPWISHARNVKHILRRPEIHKNHLYIAAFSHRLGLRWRLLSGEFFVQLFKWAKLGRAHLVHLLHSIFSSFSFPLSPSLPHSLFRSLGFFVSVHMHFYRFASTLDLK